MTARTTKAVVCQACRAPAWARVQVEGVGNLTALGSLLWNQPSRLMRKPETVRASVTLCHKHAIEAMRAELAFIDA